MKIKYTEMLLKVTLIISSISSTIASYYINSNISNKIASLELKLTEAMQNVNKAKEAKKLAGNIINKFQHKDPEIITSINPYYEPTFILKVVVCTAIAITIACAAYYLTSTTIEVCGIIKTSANDTKESLNYIPEKIQNGANEIIKSTTNNVEDAIEEVYSSSAKTAINSLEYTAGNIITDDKITYEQTKTLVDIIETAAGDIQINNESTPCLNNFGISEDTVEKCKNYAEDIFDIMKDIL